MSNNTPEPVSSHEPDEESDYVYTRQTFKALRAEVTKWQAAHHCLIEELREQSEEMGALRIEKAATPAKEERHE